MKFSAKKITTTAMLAAIGYVVMVFIRIPLIPAASFLEYDPKDVLFVIIGFLIGPVEALISIILVCLLEMVTVSDSGPIGLLMNVIASVFFVMPAALIYRKFKTLPGAIGGLATGVSTLAKLLNPKIKVIGVEPAGANCMQESIKAGHVVALPSVNTIADGTAVKTPGSEIFPYIQKNLDDIITIEDDELIVAFLDMVENHKMVVENSGLLTVAALNHIKEKNKRIVSILSGGNMDIITMSSMLQHGLIARDRIFTISVLLPDKPGELVKVATLIANEQGNVVKLEHNQFVSINRNEAVELKITIEAFGTDHKNQIMKALRREGYTAKFAQPVI